MVEQRIQQQFFENADLLYAAAAELAKPIAEAAQVVVACLTAGGKVLVCGQGSSAGNAQHFAARLVGRFERDRPGLAALALSSNAALLDSNQDSNNSLTLFSKQVQTLGQPGDVLLALSTSGNTDSVLAAVDSAHAQDMTVVALTGRSGGRSGGRLGESLLDTDIHLCVPHERNARIQEVHLLALHCLCDAVDLQLLGEQDPA